MVRLALVDLSERGQQPIWSPDGQVAIVFNGEMYNHAEERARLVAKGYTFRSTSDTEVVLALYLERGVELVDHIRGMFCFALLDWRGRPKGSQPSVLLGRDPFGIKPLYLAQPRGEEGPVAFASELRGLRAGGFIDGTLDRGALADFLSLGFVPQPRSIFEGATMLGRGTLMQLVPGQKPKSWRFWTLPPPSDAGLSFTESAERLRATLEESIRLHALADAPVGAFLSGGVDSTAIASLMVKHNPKLRTYTVKLDDPAFDESAQAREVAQRLGCVHTEVELRSAELPDHAARFAAAIDQPSTDGLNTWLVSRAAAKDVKGVLSGLGGDEWFAGYPVAQRMARLEHQPALQRAANLLGRVPFAPRFEEPMAKLRARSSGDAMWAAAHQVFRPEQVERMTGTAPTPVAEHLANLAGPPLAHESPVDRALELDVFVYMGCQLLRDSDTTSMASSLELRVPFVDVELARFARSCPPSYRMDPSQSPASKRVLHEALRDVLPADMSKRPKRGFALPMETWLSGPLDGFAHEAVAHLRSRNVLESIPDQRQLSVYPQRWALMSLGAWLAAVRSPAEDSGAAAATG